MKLKITKIENEGIWKDLITVDIWTDNYINLINVSQSMDRRTAIIEAREKLRGLIVELNNALGE